MLIRFAYSGNIPSVAASPRRALFPLILLLGFAPLIAQRGTDRSDWIQLFNGRNLDGWTPKITSCE